MHILNLLDICTHAYLEILGKEVYLIGATFSIIYCQYRKSVHMCTTPDKTGDIIPSKYVHKRLQCLILTHAL